MPTNATLSVGPRSLATILAALRFYQAALAANDDLIPPEVADIATNGDAFDAMGAAEIDTLCETLNTEA